MSSQARDTLNTQPDTGVDQIQDFIELTAVCGQLQEGFQIDVPDDGIFSLKADEVTFIFLDSKIWHDSHRMRPFLAKVGEPDLIFICIGSDEEIENLSNFVDPMSFRPISLPIRKRQLRNAIANVQRLQSLAINAGKASATVNETNENVKYVLQVSRELNGIRDSKKLLSLILQKARQITNADAGSIY
ncbi:MAG: hypothetical protein EOP10_34860, partial [Proteobacteria bacterium]